MLFFSIFLLLGTYGVSDALRVKENIRIPLTGVKNNCMKLLNGTHEFGCQSEKQGNTGVLSVIRTIDDIQRHLNGLPWGLSKLIALVNVKNLDRKLLDELRDNTDIVGIVLYHDQKENFEGFSEDGFCPNREQSFYSPSTKCDWNQNAALTPDGTFFAQYNKPVFIIDNQTEIGLLIDSCYRPFNQPSATNDYRCVARMGSFMLAAGDAVLCIKRQYYGSLTNQGSRLCDVISDYNVISILPAIDATQKSADIITLATRLDSFSMFSESRGGDTSSLVSVITALSVARSIGNGRAEFEQKTRQTSRQFMLAFFHGESLGYIGSSRFVYDMQKQSTEKPKYKPEKSAKELRLDDLNAFIELQQLSANHSIFYLHGDEKISKMFDSELKDLKTSAEFGAQKSSGEVKDLYNRPGARIPPASYQSFLKAKHIPGFVIAPFNDYYETKTLNSFFDTQLSDMKPDQKTRDAILRDVNTAGNIAMRVVLDFVGKKDDSFSNGFLFDREFASQLIDCLIFDPKWNCPLFESLLKGQDVQIRQHDTYMQVGEISAIRKLVSVVMTYVMGNTDAATNIKQKSECLSKNKNQDIYSYYWQYDPKTEQFRCYQTSIYQPEAISPAFEIENYDFTNTTYSSWVESRWNRIQMEIFLDTGYKFELHALGLALIVVSASGVLFYLLDESYFFDPSDVLPAEV